MTAVAFLTIAAAVTFVIVLLFMATQTGHIQFQLARFITTDPAPMAVVALGLFVLITQRKLGGVVVKIAQLPATLVVAGFAFVAQITPMPFFVIVFFVASNALAGPLGFVEVAFVGLMAGTALDLAVLALERVVRVLIVVEDRFFPGLVVVAAFTFAAVTALVAFVVV